MQRRTLLVRLITLGTWALAASTPAHAQPKPARIGILTYGFASESVPVQAFRASLAEHGYIEGRTVQVEYRFAQGKADRLASLAAELISSKVDVIVTEGTPTALALKGVTQTVPVVMAVVSDPVALGIVRSLARPGGNITGLTFSVADRPGKQLQLLKETLPHATSVGVIYNSSRADADVSLGEANAAARKLGIALQLVGVKTLAELAGAHPAMLGRRLDAVITLGDGMFWQNRKRLLEFVVKNRLPAVFPEREFAEDGGLMAYGPDATANFRRAAAFVDKIIKGAKPADMPIEQPTKLELVVNLKTASLLGVSIPPAILVRADKLIQ